MAKRKRRAFTNEFKAEAVRLVRESGKSVRRWRGNSISPRPRCAAGYGRRDRCRPWDAGRAHDRGARGTRRLRRENRTLRMERDILKKATAFFAKENP